MNVFFQSIERDHGKITDETFALLQREYEYSTTPPYSGRILTVYNKGWPLRALELKERGHGDVKLILSGSLVLDIAACVLIMRIGLSITECQIWENFLDPPTSLILRPIIDVLAQPTVKKVSLGATIFQWVFNCHFPNDLEDPEVLLELMPPLVFEDIYSPTYHWTSLRAPDYLPWRFLPGIFIQAPNLQSGLDWFDLPSFVPLILRAMSSLTHLNLGDRYLPDSKDEKRLWKILFDEGHRIRRLEISYFSTEGANGLARILTSPMHNVERLELWSTLDHPLLLSAFERNTTLTELRCFFGLADDDFRSSWSAVLNLFIALGKHATLQVLHIRDGGVNLFCRLSYLYYRIFSPPCLQKLFIVNMHDTYAAEIGNHPLLTMQRNLIHVKTIAAPLPPATFAFIQRNRHRLFSWLKISVLTVFTRAILPLFPPVFIRSVLPLLRPILELTLK